MEDETAHIVAGSSTPGQSPACTRRGARHVGTSRPRTEAGAKSGRTEQFNSRVRPGFKERVEGFAEREGRTIGAVLDDMLAAYEAAGGSLVAGAVPAAEARAGRTRELRAFASDEVFMSVGRVAAQFDMSVSH